MCEVFVRINQQQKFSNKRRIRRKEREAKAEADAFRVCFVQNRQQTDKQNKLFSKIISTLYHQLALRQASPSKCPKPRTPCWVDKIHQGIVTPLQGRQNPARYCYPLVGQTSSNLNRSFNFATALRIQRCRHYPTAYLAHCLHHSTPLEMLTHSLLSRS